MKAFIPAKLDDFKLTPIEFRLFCHIARRDDSSDHCWESVPNMAKWCGINKLTAWKALKALEGFKLVVKARRFGRTAIFVVNDSDLWSPGRKTYPGRDLVRHVDEKVTHHVDEKPTHKGYPSKAIPLRRKGNSLLKTNGAGPDKPVENYEAALTNLFGARLDNGR